MIIRDYKETDEKEWLKCRLLSFYECSYFDDIIHKKETYKNNLIDLVAEDNGSIVGFIEIEYEINQQEVCYLKGDLGGNIWNIGVLPEYQNQGLAGKLLDLAIGKAKELNLTRLEAWTQDDIASNGWYEKNKFKQEFAYLNVYADKSFNELITENIGETFGIRMLNFEAPIDRKDELKEKYSRVHEVKLYELKF